jgi:hypothetical protein
MHTAHSQPASSHAQPGRTVEARLALLRRADGLCPRRGEARIEHDVVALDAEDRAGARVCRERVVLVFGVFGRVRARPAADERAAGLQARERAREREPARAARRRRDLWLVR